MSNLPTTFLKLGFALAKHHIKNLIGDEALEVVATTLTDVGGEKVQAKVDSIFASKEGQKELLKAAKAADENFREKCKDNDLRQLFTMDYGNLPTVQEAIAKLPEALGDELLRETLFTAFRNDAPKKISDERINEGVSLYVECLQSAIVTVKDFGLRIIHNALMGIGKDVKDIQADVKLLLEKTKTDAQSVAETLPVDYKGHFLSSLPGLHITPDLIMPYEKTSNEVVVGRTISIDHIRDQRFMLRDEVLADVLSELDLFLRKHLNNFNPEILTFWISGRSGSGKSVLLLQVMQEIVLKRNAQVIWLDDAAEMLPSLLEKWATQKIDIGKPLFVFVDDFNSPQTRDKIDFKTVARLLRNPKFRKLTWPVLVTCSPPEYFEEFQKTGDAEYFQIKKWLIPPIFQAEQSSFLEWFNLRTGEVASPGAAFEQDKGLVLSMMLELRHGNIIEFAKRFKERLEGSNLLEQMVQPLALNRLYIWAPANSLDELTPEQQDALSALNLDQDFSVLDIENSSKNYIRLTHPHLSDSIYKAIRPDNFGYQRANDLASAFEKAITVDDVLASRILLVIAQGGERISNDLNEKILAEKIVAHCDRFVEIVNKSHPINLAFIWTNLAKWASRELYINSLFSIPPLDNAIIALGTDHHSWGDLWLQLWACYPKNKKLVETGWNWVKNRFHLDEAAWYPIWNTLLINSEVLPDDVAKTDILRMGIVWLNGREDRRWWSRIWENILENSNEIPSEVSVSEIIQAGENWLRGREDSGQWSFVWQGVLKYSQTFGPDNTITEALDYGVAWLDGRQDQTQWAFVWQDILKYTKHISPSADITKLLEIGTEWLFQRESSNQWSYIWQTLITDFEKIQSSSIKVKLIKWGLSWVDKNKDRKEWPIIYNDLAKVKYSREFKSAASPKKFILIGVEWIEIHKDEARAAQLALFLIKSYQTNFLRLDLPLPDVKTYNRLLELIKYMVRKSNITMDGWPFWWLAYWETAPTIKNAHIALKWMEVYSGNLEGARSIINKLLSTKKPDVIDALLCWQQEHLQNPISEIIRIKFAKEKEREFGLQKDSSVNSIP